ncbi:hypothetical protein LTR56_001095 [Elasticomyces elasticus]|nr:hypothetical protein LTR56_001095 [Elasticomyces elasticus]KAK3663496.1 hypothetical protein LTR22_005667 [Elasticomyces elasticus]KAK4927118.1 hypothetical protein LTR49_006034 [Elasticomyces elasticus]KAK5769017.1 hypothetical protein LTS12_000730 [Elasticomyces elasticus]
METMMRTLLLLVFCFGALPACIAASYRLFGNPVLWNDHRLRYMVASSVLVLLLCVSHHTFTVLAPIIALAYASLDSDKMGPLAVGIFFIIYSVLAATDGWSDEGVATHFGSELVSPISAPPHEAPALATTFVPPPPPPAMAERPKMLDPTARIPPPPTPTRAPALRVVKPPPPNMVERPTIPAPPARIPPPPTPTRAPALRVVKAYTPVATEKPAVRLWRARVSGPQNPVRARLLSVVKAPAPVVAEMPTLPEPPACILTPPNEPPARTLSVLEAPALIVAERPAVLEPPARVPSPPNLVQARAVSVVEPPARALPDIPAPLAMPVPPRVDIPAMPHPAPAPAPTMAVLPPFPPAGMQFAPVLDMMCPVAFPAVPQMPAAPALELVEPGPLNDMEIDDVGRPAAEVPVFVPLALDMPEAPALDLEEPEQHNDGMEIDGMGQPGIEVAGDIPALPQPLAVPAQVMQAPAALFQQIPAPLFQQIPAPQPMHVPVAPVHQAPAVQPMHIPAAQPIQAPAAQPLQAPAAQPVQAPAAQPVQALAAQPTQVPAVQPMQAPVAQPVQAPAAQPMQVQVAALPAKPKRKADDYDRDEAREDNEGEGQAANKVLASPRKIKQARPDPVNVPQAAAPVELQIQNQPFYLQYQLRNQPGNSHLKKRDASSAEEVGDDEEEAMPTDTQAGKKRVKAETAETQFTFRECAVECALLSDPKVHLLDKFTAAAEVINCLYLGVAEQWWPLDEATLCEMFATSRDVSVDRVQKIIDSLTAFLAMYPDLGADAGIAYYEHIKPFIKDECKPRLEALKGMIEEIRKSLPPGPANKAFGALVVSFGAYRTGGNPMDKTGLLRQLLAFHDKYLVRAGTKPKGNTGGRVPSWSFRY